MLLLTACLLLLACALVQGLASLGGRRAALAGALAVTALHVAVATATALPLVASLSLLGCFWMTTSALLVAHLRDARRLGRLSTLCDVDETTGCLNRRGFSTRLDQVAARARAAGTPVALVALDLDHFKLVNDRFGHLSGDAVLGEVGAALTQAVPAPGLVARLGGEEFAVLLPDTDAEHAGVLAERILASFRTLRLEALPVGTRLTMSAGIAVERMDDPHSSDALRARADEALYAAKRNGRDRALLWAPGVHSHATPPRSLPGIIRRIPDDRSIIC